MYGYIYLILNKINGKTYIGQHKSSKEWFEDDYMGSGKLIKYAFQKNGKSNFEKFLIQYCTTFEELNNAEKFWIDYYRKLGKAEYNLASGGSAGWGGWNKGKKMPPESLEVRQKRSLSHLGKSSGMKGKTPWNKGKKGVQKISEETRMKLSKIHKGKSNKNKGKHWYNNGKISTLSKECPSGWTKGRIIK